MAEACDLIITCLPNPQASAQVLEAPDGILAGLRQGSFWLEMSTNDAREVKRLGALIGIRGRASGGLSRLRRLSPGGLGQHFHFRGMRSGDL